MPESKVAVTVELTADEFKSYLEAAAKSLSEKRPLAGFRPGKVSYEIAKNAFGESALLNEAAEQAISKTYPKALVDQKLATIDHPAIAINQLGADQPFIYEATATTLPEVKIGDYQKIKITKPVAEASDADVDKVIEDIRKLRAAEQVVERAAQVGDRVMVDFEVKIDKVVIEGGAQKNYPLTIGENRFIPGFEDQVVGMSVGETKDFVLSFPETYHQANLAGKPADFTVTCQKVSELILPEVNDDFAQLISHGHAKTVDALRQSIKENIIQEQNERNERKVELELFEKLIEKSTFGELPAILLERENEKMMHELEDSIGRQGLPMDQYLTMIKKTIDELKAEFAPQAEQRVKTALVARQLFIDRGLEVTDDEIEQEIKMLLAQYNDRPEAKQSIESDSYREYLHHVLSNRKLIDLLKSELVA